MAERALALPLSYDELTLQLGSKFGYMDSSSAGIAIMTRLVGLQLVTLMVASCKHSPAAHCTPSALSSSLGQLFGCSVTDSASSTLRSSRFSS